MTRLRPPEAVFELDARVELLSALVMLARPPGRKRGVGGPAPYASKVREHFAGLAAHPAVAGLGRLLDRGVPEHLFAEMILLQPDARRLEAEPARTGGLLTQAGGKGEVDAFFEALRDFAARASWQSFFKARKREQEAFLALARAESAKSQKPEAVSAYLRMPFPGKCRMILAPLLPREFAVNVSRDGVELRVRNGSWGAEGLTFELDAFDCCVAHELTHTVLAPLIEGSRAIFASYPVAPLERCRDSSSWSGCVEEHLVRAITLRALNLGGGEKPYRTILRRWARGGYPYLEAFCASLSGFEQSPRSRDFAAFYPELIASFKA